MFKKTLVKSLYLALTISTSTLVPSTAIAMADDDGAPKKATMCFDPRRIHDTKVYLKVVSVPTGSFLSYMETPVWHRDRDWYNGGCWEFYQLDAMRLRDASMDREWQRIR